VFGLESANVVGFLEKVGTQGYSLYTPTFSDVGTDGIDIQNIKLKNASGDETEKITTFTAAGALNASYLYLNETVGMEPGWYNSNWEPIEEIVEAGKGFLVWNTAGTAAFEVSGEVAKGPLEIPVSLGYSIMGNSTPVEIDIQDIVLVGANGDETEKITTFTAAGALNSSYLYLNETVGMEPGWYNSNWEPIEETVQPGAAFLIWNTSASNLKLKLPAAY